MNRLLAIAAIAAMNVSLAAPAALAQGSGAQVQPCPAGTKACVAPIGTPPKATPAQVVPPKHAPKPGASGRDGHPFQRAANSRFPAPPKGQQYRVVQDNLVLVDSKTMTIVKVLGLLDTLTR